MNRLQQETSPYLLQHAANPVDWHPWGDEALKLAASLDRPIFLSVGYSACHWCHVMERESFENEKIASFLNEHFVSIKVDREERPDLDEIYMKAVQSLTGQGGWPMSVFLTPDQEPFFGGTYFPPDSRYGRPGFMQVLEWIYELWTKKRDQVAQQGRSLTEAIVKEGTVLLDGDLDPQILDRSFGALAGSFDATWGGFGEAPKFPHAMDLRLCLRHWKRTKNPHALDMCLVTLNKMAQGGIYDHLGGGFARYSTDEKWLIPHFEKMLYDNALLVPVYLEAYLVSEEEELGRVARETCDWVLREMVTEEGGLASTLDADSEGEEGKFYAWTPDELRSVLGERDGTWAAAWFGVTKTGNFERGTSALWRPEPASDVAELLGVDEEELAQAMEEARAKLFAKRAERVPPGKDDKVLAGWNGLMISALAQAYQTFASQPYLDTARRAMGYVLEGMRQPDGRLWATARHGRAHLNAYLDDYAFVIQGLIDLYESDFDQNWIREALDLNEILTERFEDKEKGGYYTTASDHDRLIARLKNPHDGALPAGNAVQALNLMRLAELTGEAEYAVRGERTIRSVGALVNRHPAVFSQLLLAVDHLQVGPREIVLAGEPGQPEYESLLRAVRRSYVPQRIVARAFPDADLELMPLLEGKLDVDPPRAYVCRNYACSAPALSVEELADQLV